jgi:hypothetical protein
LATASPVRNVGIQADARTVDVCHEHGFDVVADQAVGKIRLIVAGVLGFTDWDAIWNIRFWPGLCESAKSLVTKSIDPAANKGWSSVVDQIAMACINARTPMILIAASML